MELAGPGDWKRAAMNRPQASPVQPCARDSNARLRMNGKLELGKHTCPVDTTVGGYDATQNAV